MNESIFTAEDWIRSDKASLLFYRDRLAEAQKKRNSTHIDYYQGRISETLKHIICLRKSPQSEDE